MIYNNFKNISIIGIMIILLISSYVSSISGFSNDVNQKKNNFDEDSNLCEDIKVACSCYGISAKSSKEIEMPYSDAKKLLDKLNVLSMKIACDPLSAETEQLKQEIITIAKGYNLISQDTSMEKFKPPFVSSLNLENPKKAIMPVTGIRGTAALCNFATVGEGSQFPIIILPRLIPILLIPIPRVYLHWSSISAESITSCGSYLTGTGFIGVGRQTGTALGFWGIGFSVFLPPVMAYGFFGYALFATCTADIMEPWPPNYAPEISAVTPENKATNVPISTSELSFRISDKNGDKMDYTVTTDPDIGSGGGSKKDGTYSIPISGLEGSEEYTWLVEAYDGEKITVESYLFSTEAVAPIVSDPNPKDGRKFIPFNLSHLSFGLEDPQGDLMDYTVETVPDIGSGIGFGVNGGTYSVQVSDLKNLTDYTWYVNVTDGVNWKHKVFSFQTEPKMMFDPFEEGWKYRKKITIDHTKVTEDLINFPVLISTTDSDIQEKAQSDGDDILFMDGLGVATRLYHEIEQYDVFTGELVVWMNSTNLISDKDTIFYIYYGNPTSKNQQTLERTWDSHYKAVYHMNYNSGGLIDSTTNDIDCDTILGNPEYSQTGKIGYAIDFEKSNDEAFKDGDVFDGLDEMTVEAWINLESYHSSHSIIASHEDSWYFHVHREFDAVIFGTHGGVHNSLARDNINCPLGVWYYAVGTWSDPHDRMQLFGNGELKDTYTDMLSMQNSDDHFAIGYQDNNGNYFDGVLDEIRISDIERNESWIGTTYYNQNEPNSFLSFGFEETGS